MRKTEIFKSIKNILTNRFRYRMEPDEVFLKNLQEKLTELGIDVNSISIHITDSRKECDGGKVYFREQLNIVYRSDCPEPPKYSKKIYLFAETKYYNLDITVLSKKYYNEAIYSMYKALTE